MGTMLFDGRNRVRYNYSRYGYTRGGGKTWHGGLDIEGLDSTTIRMPWYNGKEISGTVTRARIVTDKSNATWEWGYYVCVQLDAKQTPDAVNFLYFCHNSKNLVQVGQKVKSGDALAIMGNTGNAAQANPPFAHCHFEVRATATGKGLDPTAYAGIPNEVGTYGKAAADADNNTEEDAEMTKIPGIDASHHQKAIDWDAVKNSGKVRFAIVRAGYGRYDDQVDAQFERNYSECKRLGIPVGTYWYSYATTVAEVNTEMEVFLRTIKGKQFEYPVYFDQEYEKDILTLTNAQRTAIVKAALEALEAAGYYAGLYCSRDWINNKLHASELSAYDLWVADYTSAEPSPAVLPYGMRQVSSSNSFCVPGIPAEAGSGLDCDYAYKDYPAIIKGAGLNGWSASSGGGSATDKPSTGTPALTLTAGAELKLQRVSLYVSSSAKNAAGTKTGTYYLWSAEVVSGRVRITNTRANVGKAGQVTGWINASDACAALAGGNADKPGTNAGTTLTIGPVSRGDWGTIRSKCQDLQLLGLYREAEAGGMHTITVGPLSAGDVATLKALCEQLQLVEMGLCKEDK